MKLFTNGKLTKSQLRKEICAMAKDSGVKRVTFNRKAKHVMGTYNPLNKVIYIDCKQSRKDMLLTFFHEMGHFTAIKRKKWLNYHMDPGTPLISTSRKFDIENKVDKIAKELWNKHVDTKAWGKYIYGYPKSEKRASVNWLSKYY
jgi:Zn-dependent peptidase ImmA (M78 family)